MGLIRRSFSFLDADFFKKLYVTLYVTLVRPHLEYAQSVWASHLKNMWTCSRSCRCVQQSSSTVSGNLSYKERLARLELPTLNWTVTGYWSIRRARGDLIEVYKHLHIYTTRTSSHDHQLIWNKSKDGTRGLQNNSFYFRTIPVYGTTFQVRWWTQQLSMASKTSWTKHGAINRRNTSTQQTTNTERFLRGATHLEPDLLYYYYYVNLCE